MQHKEELILNNKLLDKTWENLSEEEREIYVNGAKYMIENEYFKGENYLEIAKKIFNKQKVYKKNLLSNLS